MVGVGRGAALRFCVEGDFAQIKVCPADGSFTHLGSPLGLVLAWLDGWEYHITVAYGVGPQPGAESCIEALRCRYNGAGHTLWVSHVSGSGVAYLDGRDLLCQDPEIERLRGLAGNERSRFPLHLSM